MKTSCTFFFLLYALCNNVTAQEKKSTYTFNSTINNVTVQETKYTYTLNGTIDIDTGSIRLMLYPDKDYYPYDSEIKVTFIDHGKFTFTGIIAKPLAFKLRVGDYYLSGEFLIDPGTQTIICDKDSFRVVPKITNKSMEELSGNFKNSFNAYHKEREKFITEDDSLRKAYNGHLPEDLTAKRSARISNLSREYYGILIAYIKKHPDSYVALSKLCLDVDFGYLPIYDTVYTQFSSAIKHSYIGTVLKKKLDGARSIDIGKVFPVLSLLDTGLSPQTLPLINGAHKYTLIDFWFSHCGPCLGQFPKYKKIYGNYKKNDLEIIGISVDKSKDIKDWKKVIQEKELSWPQYLDEDGKLAGSLAIYTFPRNFLLDEHNIVIKKDVTPEQLEQIMAK